MASYHIAPVMLRGFFEDSRRTHEELSKNSRRSSFLIQNEYSIDIERPGNSILFHAEYFLQLFQKILFYFFSLKLSLFDNNSAVEKKINRSQL